MEKFTDDGSIQQVEEDLKDETDEAVCNTKYGEVFFTRARGEVHNFLMSNCLCMEEEFLPPVEQS